MGDWLILAENTASEKRGAAAAAAAADGRLIWKLCIKIPFWSAAEKAEERRTFGPAKTSSSSSSSRPRPSGPSRPSRRGSYSRRPRPPSTLNYHFLPLNGAHNESSAFRLVFAARKEAAAEKGEAERKAAAEKGEAERKAAASASQLGHLFVLAYPLSSPTHSFTHALTHITCWPTCSRPCWPTGSRACLSGPWNGNRARLR